VEAKARVRHTILVSLHIFTPHMDGVGRPWHIGILHGCANDRFALAMLRNLEARQDVIVGDNEPYVMDDRDYTVPRHAYSRDLLYVELELSHAALTMPGGGAPVADRRDEPGNLPRAMRSASLAASWASDRSAVKDQPALRRLPGAKQAGPVDDVFAAMRALDEPPASGASLQ